MDASITRIADYASSLQYTDLSADAIHHAKRRIIDSLGCALGAYDAEPCRIARKVALRSPFPAGATVLGTAQRTLPELAGFANAVMVRYLDANDSFHGGGGHPSDCMGGILAMAEAAGADGKGLITAVTLAYEVYYNVYQAMDNWRDKGWDHVYYTAIASAVGSAKAMQLDRDKIANAVALAVIPNLALEATRRGHLSMWKGCAGGNAGRNGAFAAVLASEGLTGPGQAIEGAHGLRELAGRFELSPFAGPGRPFRITEASVKCFPSEGHSQSPITAALDLYPQVNADEIQSIKVHTYWFAWSEIGSEPEKWHPTTRETADHSLPYIIAAVLIDGAFSDEIFSEERLKDPKIHRLIDKISVEEDAELSRRFPATMPCRIEVLMRNGERKVVAVDAPRGHFENPMTDAEIDAKFNNFGRRVLPAPQLERALRYLWKLDEAKELRSLFDAFRIDQRQS